MGSAGGGSLLRGSGGAEPVGVGAGGDDVAAEGEPVDHGCCEPGVGEGGAPFGEGGVGGAGDGGLLLAGGDDLEQQFGAAGVEVDVSELVEAEDRRSLWWFRVETDDPRPFGTNSGS